MNSCPVFFCDPLEDKIVYIYHSEKVFLCFAQLRPRLRLGLQSLGLEHKKTHFFCSNNLILFEESKLPWNCVGKNDINLDQNDNNNRKYSWLQKKRELSE
jgi:hypothetical protein